MAQNSFKAQERFMKIAIVEAKLAYLRGDYPIGACIVKDGKVIARGGNRVKTKGDSTKHIELELIQYVVGMHGTPYIKECILYSTHEPCPMCAGASVWSKLGGIIFGNRIMDFKKFTDESNRLKWRIIEVSTKEIVKGKGIKVIGGFMRKECNKLFELEPRT